VFTLQSITIEGFRGFPKQIGFDLDAPVVMAWGPNGAGKSSLLCAIEWCLFGSDVETEKNTGIRERIAWESRNHASARCLVETELAADGETLLVHRSQPKSGKSDFWFRVGSNAPVRDEGMLRALLGGLEIRDFFTAIHLHQESLRSILLAKPGDRRQDFYRLLGLASFLNQSKAISEANLESMLRDVDTEFEKFEAALEGKIQGRQDDIERARQDCLDEGLTESDLSRKGFAILWRELASGIRSFCAKYSITDPRMPDECPEKRPVEYARDELQKLRKSSPALKERGTVLAQINTLGGLRDAYVKAEGQLKDAEDEIRKLPPGERDPAMLKEEIQKLDEDLKKKKEKRSEVDAKAAVLSEALTYFENLDIKGKTKCPVCGQGIESVESLREHYEKEIKKKAIGQLDEHIANVKAKREAVDDARDKVEKLQGDVKRKENAVAGQRAKIATALGKEISSKDDPVAILDRELDSLTKEKDKLEKQVEKVETDLANIETQINRIAKVLHLIRFQDDLATLSETRKTEAFERVQEARLRIEEFVRAAETVSRSLTRTLEEEAEKRLGAVRDAIGENFKTLTGRSDFPRLAVSPETKFAAQVEGSSGVTDALSVLNQADTNCAAISIFLALAVAPSTSHKLGFLILDDPSQSLDEVHCERLVKIVSQIAESRQLLMATIDEDLCAHLQKEATKKKRVYQFSGWNPTKGPTVSES
jgi:DNA repair protein SbcC/Rad50